MSETIRLHGAREHNLDGVTVKGARLKKTILPFGKLPMDTVQTAIKTGARLRMEPGEIES